MRTTIRPFLCLILALTPLTASAQVPPEVVREILGLPPQVAPQPYIVQPQPLVPIIPNNAGPYGRGYSIITTTREQPDVWRRYMGERGATYQEQTTEVVPNNALGNPIRPFRPW
jgi:hypothetical protein